MQKNPEKLQKMFDSYAPVKTTSQARHTLGNRTGHPAKGFVLKVTVTTIHNMFPGSGKASRQFPAQQIRDKKPP
jgi:hypothetical protein